MKTAILSFSDRGYLLAEKIAQGLTVSETDDRTRGRESSAEAAFTAEAMRCGQPLSLKEWTRERFHSADALIYVGAAGIAVRAIAPYIRKKTLDPAVIVADEGGNFVISLLSGHIGGANALAGRVAELIGAVPVITTATDVHGLFAVDSWAVQNSCVVLNPEHIKDVSGALLRGETIGLYSPWKIRGRYPERVKPLQLAGGKPEDVFCTEQSEAETQLQAECLKADHPACPVLLDVVRHPKVDGLCLVPRIAGIGIGCRRGTSAETIEKAFEGFLEETGIYAECITDAASIDLKADEKGLLAFCRSKNWPIRFFTAAELMETEGVFAASDFVLRTTGADNVCERSAVRITGGRLYAEKYAKDGVTFALALRDYCPRFL